ncbi:hypothetical protein RSO41_12635 [Halomonas sp. I1]|uniref:hypothetical protein n=1 Tax=Halomonas sp. I1 TaxID=393536 RepID=UPI0028DE55EB|nr:hypothetical protein [Halomonas sp. I1]MDT8895503.1 hypothetical protein [Halomonas sp. I1]
MYTNIRYSETRHARTGTKTVTVNTPYHPEIVDLFNNLGGQWNSEFSGWTFDPRDLPRVREALIHVFGTDGEDGAELVTAQVRFDADYYEDQQAFFFAGREIARAYGRDTGAKLGPGVTVVEGPAPTGGGSMKNWKTVIRPGTVIEIKDLPRPAIEKALNEYADDKDLTITVTETPANREQLEARRAKLVAELAEIDQQLAEI